MSVVRYRVHADHHTKTLRGDTTVAGSVHHPELAEFTGLVTQSHDDGTHDLVIFPPGRAPVHVAHVGEGVGAGSFSFVEAPSSGRKR